MSADRGPESEMDASVIVTRLRAGTYYEDNLRNCNLDGEDLSYIDFGNLDVSKVIFQDSLLEGANLSNTRGLLPHQLSGADLTNCKLPENLSDFPLLDHIKNLSKSSGIVLVSTLVLGTFLLLAGFSTSDLDILTDSGRTKLPILNTELSTRPFIIVAPLLLLIAFTTLHIYLSRLWSMIATMPAVFPDGCPLTLKIYPWVVNELAISEFPRMYNMLAVRFLLFTVLFFSVPVSLVLFVGRCMILREVPLATWHVGLVVLSVFISRHFFYVFKSILRERSNIPSTWRKPAGPIFRVFAHAVDLVLLAVLTAVIWSMPRNLPIASSPAQRSLQWDVEENMQASILGSYSARIENVLASRDAVLSKKEHIELKNACRDFNKSTEAVTGRRGIFIEDIQSIWGVKLFNFNGNIEAAGRNTLDFFEAQDELFLDLSPKFRADLVARNRYSMLASQLPDRLRVNYHAQPGGDGRFPAKRVADLIGSGPGFDREHFLREWRVSLARAHRVSFSLAPSFDEYRDLRRDLRGLRAADSYLVGADFRGTDLSGADFRLADLRGVRWAGEDGQAAAILSFAVFEEARLQLSNFQRCTLSGANFSNASMMGSVFYRSNLHGASLISSDVRLTNFSSSILIGAVLSNVDGLGSDFSFADLKGANLSFGSFEGCDFFAADLRASNLLYADFTGSLMHQVDLSGANLSKSKFEKTSGFDTVNLNGAFFCVGDEPDWPSGWKFQWRDGGDVGRYQLSKKTLNVSDSASKAFLLGAGNGRSVQIMVLRKEGPVAISK